MLYHITFTGVRRMKKSPYDRERFFEKYSQMDRSRLGLAGAGEWESLEPLLPDFAGKRVLDLGCGYGWHCIYAADSSRRRTPTTWCPNFCGRAITVRGRRCGRRPMRWTSERRVTSSG